MREVAVVTGGTSGIGFEISKQLLVAGVDVYGIYLSNDDKARKAEQELSKLGSFKTVKLDVADETQVKEFFNQLDQLDFLINCAGISIEDDFEKQPITDIKKTIDINLYGKMIPSKYALTLLKKSAIPRIINIASRFAQKPFITGVMGYCCSESAIVMMTKVLALEYAKYNIKVNTVSPSLTLTPMTESVCTKEEIETISKKNPSGRLGKPIDIANMVIYLCSEKADYITGENININGGILLI